MQGAITRILLLSSSGYVCKENTVIPFYKMETKLQVVVTGPRSHTQKAAEPGFEHRPSGSRAQVFPATLAPLPQKWTLFGTYTLVDWPSVLHVKEGTAL